MEQQLNGNNVSLKDEDYELFTQIYNDMKSVNCFEYNGYIFLGEKVEVIKRYLHLKPSKKFFIWLQDNVEIIKSH